MYTFCSVKRNEILARNVCFTSILNSKKDEGSSKKVAELNDKSEAKALKQKEAKAKLNMLLETMSKVNSYKYFIENCKLIVVITSGNKKNIPSRVGTNISNTKIC